MGANWNSLSWSSLNKRRTDHNVYKSIENITSSLLWWCLQVIMAEECSTPRSPAFCVVVFLNPPTHQWVMMNGTGPSIYHQNLALQMTAPYCLMDPLTTTAEDARHSETNSSLPLSMMELLVETSKVASAAQYAPITKIKLVFGNLWADLMGALVPVFEDLLSGLPIHGHQRCCPCLPPKTNEHKPINPLTVDICPQTMEKGHLGHISGSNEQRLPS